MFVVLNLMGLGTMFDQRLYRLKRNGGSVVMQCFVCSPVGSWPSVSGSDDFSQHFNQRFLRERKAPEGKCCFDHTCGTAVCFVFWGLGEFQGGWKGVRFWKVRGPGQPINSAGFVFGKLAGRIRDLWSKMNEEQASGCAVFSCKDTV